MMNTLFILCGICVTGSLAQFSPTVTLTCDLDNFVVAISGSTSTGQVFVDGECGPQSTSAGSSSHTFNSAACTVGSYPGIGNAFTVVVQEFASFEASSDYIISLICNKDLTAQEKTLSGATVQLPGSPDSTGSGSLAPTFTLSLLDGNGNALTSGFVGTPASLVVTMDSSYTSEFDHQITSIDANDLTVISSGCSLFSTLSNANGASSGGAVGWDFSLFIPYTTATRAATTVGFTVTIGVCDGTCTVQTCGSRKRRDFEGSPPNITTLYTSAVVYPKDYIEDFESIDSRQTNDNVCVSRTPMTAALAGLALSMAVCLVITVCMFVRMRKANRKNKADELYANHNAGYRN